MTPTYQASEQKQAKDVPVSDITKALKGVNYPADRSKLVQKARGNDAPQPVLDAIEKIPSREYESESEVKDAFQSKVKQGGGQQGGTKQGGTKQGGTTGKGMKQEGGRQGRGS